MYLQKYCRVVLRRIDEIRPIFFCVAMGSSQHSASPNLRVQQCMAMGTMKEPKEALVLELLTDMPELFIQKLYEVPIAQNLDIWKFVGPLVHEQRTRSH